MAAAKTSAPPSPRTLDELVERIEGDDCLAGTSAEFAPSRDLAAQLVAIRKAAGWSQADLARQVGVTQGRIAQLESGSANPSIQTIARLLRRAGVTVSLRLEHSGEVAGEPISGGG
jgi:DNA-binding XRE family transcriptional regulator